MVRAWLAERPRYNVHNTPTYSSQLNQVERWFALMNQRILHCGSFKSVAQATERIDRSLNEYNANTLPFV